MGLLGRKSEGNHFTSATIFWQHSSQSNKTCFSLRFWFHCEQIWLWGDFFCCSYMFVRQFSETYWIFLRFLSTLFMVWTFKNTHDWTIKIKLLPLFSFQWLNNPNFWTIKPWEAHSKTWRKSSKFQKIDLQTYMNNKKSYINWF